MIVILCVKYKKNPARTVDATKRTRFSKSRPNDLEDIGQGQASSHATHPLMLLIICTKYGKNPSWTVDATGRTREVNGQTDRGTDDKQGESKISGLELTTRDIKYHWWFLLSNALWDLWDASQVITAKWHYTVAVCEGFIKAIWSPGDNLQHISLVVWLAECVKYLQILIQTARYRGLTLSKSWVHGWDSGCLLVRDNACMCQWVCAISLNKLLDKVYS